MSVTVQPEVKAELIDRRRLLRCAAVCGAAAPVLVACGSGEEDPTGTAGSDDTGGGGGASGDVLVPASEVPVGGGVVLDDVVVTQPTEGEFLAYTAACTHQGGKITAVSDGVMTCSLHGSQFAIEDGENVVGPNGDPGGSVADLPQVEIAVDGDDITRA